MKQVMCKKDTQFTHAGRTYWYCESDFCNHCWHIYVSDNKDTHLFNLFSEEEFNELFEVMEGEE